MPLPAPEVERQPLHTRTVRVDAFSRADGLFDLEAELLDVKHYDFPLVNPRGGIKPAGEPVHHMRLRITIDGDYLITAAQAQFETVPYGENCAGINSAYGALVGMNLLKNFRDTVKRRFARTAGCTHMTELSYVLPTVAVQAMASRRRQQAVDENKRPFQIGGCFAQREDGPVVQEFYPKWYVKPSVSS